MGCNCVAHRLRSCCYATLFASCLAPKSSLANGQHYFSASPYFLIMENLKIPDKLFFSIGEVSKITEVEPHILRYWEQEFKKVKPERNKKGERNYTKKEIEAILKLKTLLYKDLYTVKGAKQKLRERVPKEELKRVDIIKFLKGIRKELISLRRTLKL